MALTLLFLSGLLVLAWLLLAPLKRSLRRAALRRRPFPAAWRQQLRREWPLYGRLPADQQLRLKGLMQVFLAEKPIIGCAGLDVTEPMRVLIAAQACLPLLGRTRGYYPKLRQLLVYPGHFFVTRAEPGAGGVQRDARRLLAGESWGAGAGGGQVILSWDAVRAGAADGGDGQNVVVHELAHQLDQVKGVANGAPPLASRSAQRRWSRVMQAEFDALREQLAAGLPGFLDPYGASEPAEFFACASEAFFEQGARLRAERPLLYRELHSFYGVHTADWAG